MRTGSGSARGLVVTVAAVVMGIGVVLPATYGQIIVLGGPAWKVGDTWQVGTWHAKVFRPEDQAEKGTYEVRGRMIAVTFEVTGRVKVGAKTCHEVRVTYPREDTGFQRRYQLYYDVVTGRMVRVRDISIRPDGSVKDMTTELPADQAGPVFVEDVPGPMPLEWPDTVQENVSPQVDGAGVRSQESVPVRGTVSDAVGGAEKEVTLSRWGTQGLRKVVQRWRGREPWWRVARKYEDGKLVGEAVLLEVNGQPVANPSTAGE